MSKDNIILTTKEANITLICSSLVILVLLIMMTSRYVALIVEVNRLTERIEIQEKLLETCESINDMSKHTIDTFSTSINACNRSLKDVLDKPVFELNLPIKQLSVLDNTSAK